MQQEAIPVEGIGQTDAVAELDTPDGIRFTGSMRLILSTFSDEGSASSVIRILLDEGLIACGSILPGVRSIYRWKGNVEESAEVQVLLKSSPEVASRCMARLTELHPYEVPEIVEMEPSAVAEPYASWIRESLSRGV